MPRFQRSVRPILNVGELMHGPIRYEKPASDPAPGTGVSPDEYRNHMMQRAQQSRAYAEQQSKAHPTQAPAPKPETPGFWETYWQVPGKLLDVAKDKIDPHTDKVPGLHALSRAPGTVYEGAAKAIPQGIKDINIAGYRLGDAADAVAQTFSPVSLDPKATPTDHAAQFGMAWSGGKVLGKGAQALGKHGGKIVNGAGLGAMFGPDAVAGAADHAARMFGREVPSMAAAGGPRLGIAPHTPAPRPMPQKANMAGGGGGSGPGPSPGPKKKPGRLQEAYDSIPLPDFVKQGIAGAVSIPVLSNIGNGISGLLGNQNVSRSSRERAERENAPPTARDRERSERGYRDAEAVPKTSDRYLVTQQNRKKKAEKERLEQERLKQQQGGK